jgi:hypothetical protein
MTGNNDTQHATRMLRTRDLESGEELLMVYYPDAGVITIDGYLVTRAQDLGDFDGKAVFHRPIGDKLFTVATDSLSELYW